MTVEEGEGDCLNGRRSILVGIQISVNSRELLNWALAKVAKPGDQVIAIHVCRDLELKEQQNNSAVLCSLQSYLAVYEGLCNVRKINLVGQISRGTSVRRTLVQEAKPYAATALVVGAGKCSALGGWLSLARYCAKRLPSTTSVLAIHKGKVVFESGCSKQFSGFQPYIFPFFEKLSMITWPKFTGLRHDPKPSLHSSSPKSIRVDSKVFTRNHKEVGEMEFSNVSEVENFASQIMHGSKESEQDLKVNITAYSLQFTENDGRKYRESETSSLSSYRLSGVNEFGSVHRIEGERLSLAQEEMNEASSSSISLLLRELPENRPGWPLLRSAVIASSELSKDNNAHKMSVVQWVMNLPNRSFPHQPQFGFEACRKECKSEEKNRSSLSAWFELPRELETLIAANSTNCIVFTHKELQSSIIHFSPENLVGKGGCSHVYKGRLPSGQPVAVKRSRLTKKAWKDFLLEVDIMTSLQHKHITPLLGVCVENYNLISIHKFFSRGNLEENLHGKGNKSVLPWDVRYKVAIGVADALTYLHRGCSRPIIHRDVKSANILLSYDFEPQLSDFGLAVWAPTTTASITYNDVVGTFGYLAPEYFMYGKVSDKIDVYSFGVVLLELLSGRKAISSENVKGQESLVIWATPKLESGDAMDLLDANLAAKFDDDQMQRMVMAATLCITRTAQHRPEMNQILKLLHGEEDIVEWAKAEADTPKETDQQDEEAYPIPSLKSFQQQDLTLLEVDYDATSINSTEQSNHHSLEDYLHDRLS